MPGLDIIPSTTRCWTSTAGCTGWRATNFSCAGHSRIEPGGYAVALLDCPPSVGPMTLNALTAADLLIIPTQCEYYSIQALTEMIELVSVVRDRTNPALAYRLLVTMFDRRGKFHQHAGTAARILPGRAADTPSGSTQNCVKPRRPDARSRSRRRKAAARASIANWPRSYSPMSQRNPYKRLEALFSDAQPVAPDSPRPGPRPDPSGSTSAAEQKQTPAPVTDPGRGEPVESAPPPASPVAAADTGPLPQFRWPAPIPPTIGKIFWTALTAGPRWGLRMTAGMWSRWTRRPSWNWKPCGSP